MTPFQFLLFFSVARQATTTTTKQKRGIAMLNYEKLYDVVRVLHEWEISESDFEKVVDFEFPELDVNEKTFVFFTLYDD